MAFCHHQSKEEPARNREAKGGRQADRVATLSAIGAPEITRYEVQGVYLGNKGQMNWCV